MQKQEFNQFPRLSTSDNLAYKTMTKSVCLSALLMQTRST